MIPTKAVTYENTQKAIESSGKLGWEILNIRMLTNHPDDHYLMVTLCKNKENEWVVHIYNSERDTFSEGYYTDNKPDAIDAYWDKR